MKPIAFTASAWSDAAPLYSDAARILARDLEKLDLESDEALNGPAWVGKRLGELGLYRNLTTAGANLGELCTIREILAYHSPLADSVFAVQGLCMNPLVLTGRHDVVVDMVTGKKIGGFALTEPHAGSDVASLRASARRDGDGWILDGEKTLISNVGIAHHFVVFANANLAAGKKGISAFFVPADAPGVTLTQIPVSGQHPLGKITLAECRLPADDLLGEVGQGLSLALGTLGIYRTSVGAAALGMAWRAIEEAVRHVNKRVQFGKLLAEQQLVQAAVADMAVELTAARFLVASAAFHNDSLATVSQDVRRREHGRRASIAKMSATESAQRIIDRAVQLHGGMGVALGTKVEELYREIRPLRIYEGATDVLKLIIAQAVLARPA
ncbi:MAG: acyl-CoA dehydrogenase [Polyangiaceae bacterium]